MLLRMAGAVSLWCSVLALGQDAGPSKQESLIHSQISSLRKVPDDRRAALTQELAFAIRELAHTPRKLILASALSNLATEGDCGKETLQAVTDTLAQAVRERPPAPGKDGQPNRAYAALARLERYENMKVDLDHPQYVAAMKQFEAVDQRRRSATFSLKDLNGKQWALEDLHGKVVLLNFWATWCPPCRKEMPDMDALYRRFREQGLVVLAVSDEEEAVVRKYIGEHSVSFPILLDADRRVAEAYAVNGIPQSLVYDRKGKVVAIAVDQRTERQFLAMLAKAGLKKY